MSSATLKLYYAQHLGGQEQSPADRIYWAYQVTHSWTELGVTWDTYDGTNLWANPGGDYTTTGGASLTMPSSLPLWVQWDVTDIVTAWVEGGQPNYGFLIRDADETQNEQEYTPGFRSREYTNQADKKPILETTYTVPGPATIESCDDTGTTKNEFSPGDDVYVVGSGYTSSLNNDLDTMNDIVRIPIYALKIVSDVDWTDGMTIPSSIVETTVSPDSSGNIAPTLVWSGATPGAYDIIVDVNCNGEYDEGIDALDDFDVENAGFFVIPEFVLGTVTGLATLFVAFGTFYMLKCRRN